MSHPTLVEKSVDGGRTFSCPSCAVLIFKWSRKKDRAIWAAERQIAPPLTLEHDTLQNASVYVMACPKCRASIRLKHSEALSFWGAPLICLYCCKVPSDPDSAHVKHSQSSYTKGRTTTTTTTTLSFARCRACAEIHRKQAVENAVLAFIMIAGGAPLGAIGWWLGALLGENFGPNGPFWCGFVGFFVLGILGAFSAAIVFELLANRRNKKLCAPQAPTIPPVSEPRTEIHLQ